MSFILVHYQRSKRENQEYIKRTPKGTQMKWIACNFMKNYYNNWNAWMQCLNANDDLQMCNWSCAGSKPIIFVLIQY